MNEIKVYGVTFKATELDEKIEKGDTKSIDMKNEQGFIGVVFPKFNEFMNNQGFTCLFDTEENAQNYAMKQDITCILRVGFISEEEYERAKKWKQ